MYASELRDNQWLAMKSGSLLNLDSPHSSVSSLQLAALAVNTKLWLRDVDRRPFAATECDNSADDALSDGNESSEDRRSMLDSCRGLSVVSHQTRPVSRFSESSFIKKLEALGVGRPSTFASILNTLQTRGYVHVDKNIIIPTLKGLIVDGYMEKYFVDLVDVGFTAAMENSLDAIASGLLNKETFLKTFYLSEKDGLLPRVRIQYGVYRVW